MSKKTLTEKVLAFLKGGDEAKLTRFENKLEKYFDKQIKTRQDNISSLQDKLVDATEELDETVLNVDLDKVNKTESAEDYCSVYVRAVKEKQDVINNLNAEIEILEEEIETLNTLKEIIENVSSDKEAK